MQHWWRGELQVWRKTERPRRIEYGKASATTLKDALSRLLAVPASVMTGFFRWEKQREAAANIQRICQA